MASKSRPVVSVALHCRYCAFRFRREFTAAEQFSSTNCSGPTVVPVGIKRLRPANHATVVVTLVTTEPGGWFRPDREVHEFMRVGVECPNCGVGNCAEVSRKPITGRR